MNTAEPTEKRKILVAILGMSPAVLTETVWELAMRKPSFIPDEVVVLTTVAGKKQMRETNLVSAWERMTEALVTELGDDSIRKKMACVDADLKFVTVLRNAAGDPADDLLTAEDNTAAADMMFRILRDYTKDDNTELCVSIAGGRKTMGALLLSCVSLLGRPGDRVLHVVVNWPFEFVNPPFFFPEQRKTYGYTPKSGGVSKAYTCDEAKIELFEVPFVPLRNVYKNLVPTDSFGRMVEYASDFLEGTPDITVDLEASEKLRIGHDDGIDLELPAAFVLYAALRLNTQSAETLVPMLAALVREARRGRCAVLTPEQVRDWPSDITADDRAVRGKLTQLLWICRDTLDEAASGLGCRLLPLGGRKHDYPDSKLHLQDPSDFRFRKMLISLRLIKDSNNE